jgi:hypothetical protein
VAAGWTAGAASEEFIGCGNGFVQFTASETNSDRMLGLTIGDTTVNQSDIGFGILLQSNGTIGVLEGGTSRGNFGPYQTGDILQVDVNLPTVTYTRNGVAFFSETVTQTILNNFYADASLSTPGATLNGISLVDLSTDPTCGGAAFWTSSNATERANNLRKDGTTMAWDTGAISQAQIVAGTGHMEFTAAETGTSRMAGLSHQETTTSFTDIDYAVFVTGTSFQAYELGVSRGTLGTYAANDRFRVQITAAGTVQYLHNGTVFFTSSVAPRYPLHVDTSLFTPGATIMNVVITSP